MKKLFKIEWIKAKYYTNFWVFFTLHAALFVLVSLFITQVNIGLPGFEKSLIFGFPNTWNVYTWLASWFNILLTITIIVLTGNEFQYRTFRQHIIDGLSRADLLKGKILIIFATALYCGLLVMLSSMIIGLSMTKTLIIKEIFSNIWLVGVYMIQAIAYMSLGLFISILVKNIALSILFFFLYFFPVEPIIRMMIPDMISNLFPMKVISNLTPMPDFIGIEGQSQFYTSVNGQVVNAHDIIVQHEYSMYVNILFSALYSIIFLGLSYYIIHKRNL
jgi:ABC-2 type transport system permease protein